MAQRALIIGLGSTGDDVCRHIAERIQWENGGLDKTPWLEFLVLETEAQQTTTDLDKNFFHLRVEANDYSNVINNPAKYREQLDLEGWWDKETLLGLQDRAITKGAGNIRMVGRLAFLFPSLCNRIRDEIQVRLDRLRRLTSQAAQEARGVLPDGSNPPVVLGEDIIIYVVGTLCGGTCSGSFIDLGYLLHYAFAASGYPIQRVGIFFLPNLAYDPLRWSRRRANAFAALKELNHFMSGNPYAVQYPFHPGRPENPTRYSPYDTTYLTQPGGGDSSSFERVKVTTAQFLHNDIFNPAAAQVGARTVDGSAAMFGGDKNGSPVTFYSFGISALEIPGYLIAQGCCYKLAVEALDDYTGVRPNALQEADAYRIKTLGISTEQIAQRLLRDPDGVETSEQGKGIPARIQDEIQRAVGSAKNAGSRAADDLAASEEVINAAFTFRREDGAPAASNAALTSALPPQIIPRRVDANSQLLQRDYEATLDREMQLALRDVNRGPVWCDVVLGEVQTYIEGRIRELSSGSSAEVIEKATQSARRSVAAARARVEACALDPFLMVLGGRKRSVDRELQAYQDAARNASRKRLDAILLAPEKQLLETLLPRVTAIRAQIVGSSASDDTALLAQARQMRSILANKLSEVDKSKPIINGEALFEPNKTIDEKYTDFWNASGNLSRHDARESFLHAWTKLPRVDRTTGQLMQTGTYFVGGSNRASGENLTRQLKDESEELARDLRPLFASLLRESVLERPEIRDTALLKDIRDKSAVMIGINRHSGLVQLTGANEVDIAFFAGAKNASATPETRAYQTWRTLEGMRDGGVSLLFEESPSPQDLQMVRALGGFSLSMVHGFQPAELEGNNFRRSFELESEKHNVHARNDIKWHPFDGDRDSKAMWRQGLILTGLCFSKTDNPNDCLVTRTNDGYIYRPPRPLGPGQDAILLPLDLREAASALRDAPRFEACLVNDVQVLRQSKPLENLAQCLEWLYENAERFPLQRTNSRFALRYESSEKTQDGQGHQPTPSLSPVTSDNAFETLKTFWRQDLAMIQRLDSRFDPDLLPPDTGPAPTPFPNQAPPAASPAPAGFPSASPAPAPPPAPVPSTVPSGFPSAPPSAPPPAPAPAPSAGAQPIEPLDLS